MPILRKCTLYIYMFIFVFIFIYYYVILLLYCGYVHLHKTYADFTAEYIYSSYIIY
jgi:hypothetical protein